MPPALKLQPQLSQPRAYQDALAAELRIYQKCLEVHRLPEIFHYWSNRHILPALNAMGAAGPADLFGQNLGLQFGGNRARIRRFVSLGSGNCDLEISLALRLRREGRHGFLFECVDLNDAMLQRGTLAARHAGLEDHLSFVQCDLNAWAPRGEYDAVIANQSLHHVVNLENLFDAVKRSLRAGGRFVISDIIGRNGHLRWPEALEIVHEFWRKLPPSYRWNRRSSCYEELFADHDCSGEGFEGVRSQDILPLLLNEFHFRYFFPFGNAIDPFIDRSFGPNFDPSRECDRAFIDRIHRCDEIRMAAGRISPTHMMAVVGGEANGSCIFPGNLSPSFCVRPPGRESKTVFFPGPTYQWDQWPDTPRAELERTCAMLVDSARFIERQTAWALSLERDADERLEWGRDLEREGQQILEWGRDFERQLDERTEWAHRLESEVQARTAGALDLQKEVASRTEWVEILKAEATGLQADVEERTLWAQRLEEQLRERTRWALRLQADLAEQTQRAERLDREIHGYLRNPFRLLFRMATAVRNRIARSYHR